MTWEEILEAMKQTPALSVTILENVPNITGGKQYLENSNKAYFDANVGAEVSKIYNGIDEDIFTITGKRKKADQKTYDFVKEVVGEMKKLADDTVGKTPEEVKELKKTITDLEEKVKNGESSGHWKRSYEEVVKQLASNKEAHDKEISTLNNTILGTNVETDITTGLLGISMNETLPKSVVDAMVNQVKAGLIQNAKIVDGKVVYNDVDGKPLLDKQYKPATAEYLLKERLKDVMKVEGTPGGGAPQGAKGEVITVGTGDSATKKLVLNKATFKTRMEFQEVAEKALMDKGITRADQDFNKLIDVAHKEYRVSELEMN